MSYSAARIAEFNAMVDTGMYGGSLTFNGTAYAVVASGVNTTKGMAQAGWQPDQDATFSMLKTTFVTSALTHRSEFTYSDDTFQLVSITNDEKEPTIRFTAKLKK